ncbi:hypothetical protein D3C78_20740 [compost metagenome]
MKTTICHIKNFISGKTTVRPQGQFDPLLWEVLEEVEIEHPSWMDVVAIPSQMAKSTEAAKILHSAADDFHEARIHAAIWKAWNTIPELKEVPLPKAIEFHIDFLEESWESVANIVDVTILGFDTNDLFNPNPGNETDTLYQQDTKIAQTILDILRENISALSIYENGCEVELSAEMFQQLDNEKDTY